VLRGARLSGPLHPNGRGHLATAALIMPTLTDTLGVASAHGVTSLVVVEDDEGDGPRWLLLFGAAAAGAAIALGLRALVARIRR